MIALFGFSLYFYNSMQPPTGQEVGLAMLGVTFMIPMIWVVLAARDAENADGTLASFIPRVTATLVLGSLFLGYSMWSVDRRISAMEVGFVVFYLAAAGIASRILKGKPRRPQLTALSGGNQSPRQRRRSH
jgi:hypothetical protein